MPRPRTGQIIEPGKNGRTTWAIRFSVPGHGRPIVTLGTTEEGWTRRKAQERLDEELAAVTLGKWEPPKREPESPAQTGSQTFHEFAESWFEAERHGWSLRTIKDYKWALELHVLPYFAELPLDGIKRQTVDSFRAYKLKEGKLAPAQINKCIKRISQILELAEEYDLIERNPARGKKRKAKEPKVQKTWIEPEQAMALIECSKRFMKPVVAVLLGTGLRPGELVNLEWPDINLLTGTIRVGKAKTDAGSYRELDLPVGVVAVLEAWWKLSEPMRDEWKRTHRGEEPVFLTKVEGGRFTGEVRRQTEANIARRLKTSIKRANVKLAELGIETISSKVTPYAARRTYASVRAALGDDPLYVSEQMGHKDVRFTLNVYSRAVKRRAKLSGAYLAEFDRALAWAKLPTSKGSVWAQLGTDAEMEESAKVGSGEDLAL